MCFSSDSRGHNSQCDRASAPIVCSWLLQQLPYPGTLYITERNSCFKSEIKETTLILPHADVTRSDKVPAALRGVRRE